MVLRNANVDCEFLSCGWIQFVFVALLCLASGIEEKIYLLHFPIYVSIELSFFSFSYLIDVIW